ncbi:hypothetical protein BDQ17DRAFT_1359438 [Cyathus striatus]|nr:hypothetical protein BDQ17DRAFT_1359438 [Cyathus striatus]
MSMRKKRKVDYVNISQSVSNVNAELELEIKIKERLVTALESRITWATTLQEALEKDQEQDITSGAFKYAALDALSAIEAPLDILYNHESPAPPNIPLQQAKLFRPPPKPKPPLFRNKASFLYIKPSAIDFVPLHGGPHVLAYLLKCPVCERTTFTSLQGLLNHARISHSLEWGTHDECVRTCAVVDPSIDLDAGIEVGLGSGGILPGLRSIFQMATGSQTQVKNDDKTDNAGFEQVPGISSSGTFLSRTLGVHEDTPALAPFLGKEPIRRGIKVWNSEEVDIDSIPIKTNATLTKHLENHSNVWRMRFQQRNIASASDNSEISRLAATEASSTLLCSRKSITSDTKHDSSSKGMKPTHQKDLDTPHTLTSSSSRFHFSARLSIIDRSLSISKDTQSNYTHKWMISVDSPSYSQNITTILQSVVVTCALGNEREVIIGYNAKEPPFVSVGFASKPFLARIELLFNGVAGDVSDSRYQRAIIEHWVELDPINMCSAVVGEEQVVDIELDKRTVIQPRRTGFIPISSKVLWDVVDSKANQQLRESVNGDLERLKKIKASTIPAYDKVLSSLISKFPLTQDMKRGKSANVPYKLVSSLREFNNLIIGRRKAIQWGRAKALQELYSQSAESGSDEGLIALSTADVYIWLVENGHFPQEADMPNKSTATLMKTEVDAGRTEDKVPSERWCRICGLNIYAHVAANIVKQEYRGHGTHSKVKQEMKGHNISNSIFGQECMIAPGELHTMKLPPLDARHVLADVSRVPVHLGSSGTWGCNEDIVNLADPRLTLGVRDVVNGLNLPHFRRERPITNAVVPYPINELGSCRGEIEMELGPYALMAILTKQFVAKLVKGGLEVAKRDGLVGNSYTEGRKKKGKGDDNVKILTPVHILSSVLSRGLGRTHQQEETDKAVLWCLSRLGVPIDSEETRQNLEQNVGLRDDGGQHVKVEE